MKEDHIAAAGPRRSGPRTGSVTLRQLTRDYPYHVELAIPPGGFGQRLNEMYGFCWTRGLQFQKRPWRKPGAKTMRWYFVNHAHAILFQREFGGEYTAATALDRARGT